MWRMIQYYAICSDTTAAKNMLNKFKEKHPTSPFLSPASDLVGISISDAKFNNREKYHNPTKEEKSITTTNDAANNKNTDAVVNKEKYGLQVGIYSTHEAADSERSRFIKTAKLRTEVLEKLVLGEKKYAVVIGNYNSEEEALKAQSIVEKQCNCKSLIFKKQ
jgi:cell division protein FtsN